MVSRKEWDKLADDFEREVCDITRETKGGQIARAVRSLPLSAEKSVLVDLGCGMGTFVERYGPLFRATFAVEHAPRIIARAKTRLKTRRDITWLTSNIPPAAKRIGRVADLTVCMNVITMPEARIRAAMWDGIARVTKKRGHALIVVPSIEFRPHGGACRLWHVAERGEGGSARRPRRPRRQPPEAFRA